MSRRLPFRASINTTYATFFKEPVRFTLVALPAPAGLALCIMFAVVMADGMEEDGTNRSWQAIAAFSLEYALFILCMGAVIFAGREALRGRKVAMTDAFAAAFERLLEMVVTSLPILATGLLLLYSAVAFSSLAWMLAGCVLVIVDLTILALSMPICLIERRGPLASLGRSLRLTRGSRLRFLAAAFVAHLPIGVSLWVFRLAGNQVVDGALTILAAAWHIVLLSILSVVALEVLSPPAEPDGGSPG